MSVGVGPTGILKDTFENCIDDFNNAVKVGNYSFFQQYLSIDDPILIQRVDDPGEFVIGDYLSIMDYLNNEQAKTNIFPQFAYNPPDFIEEHNSAPPRNRHVGHVTGDGQYLDTFTAVKPISVRYSLRFKKTAPGPGGNIWRLVTANVAPI